MLSAAGPFSSSSHAVCVVLGAHSCWRPVLLSQMATAAWALMTLLTAYVLVAASSAAGAGLASFRMGCPGPVEHWTGPLRFVAIGCPCSPSTCSRYTTHFWQAGPAADV